MLGPVLDPGMVDMASAKLALLGGFGICCCCRPPQEATIGYAR